MRSSGATGSSRPLRYANDPVPLRSSGAPGKRGITWTWRCENPGASPRHIEYSLMVPNLRWSEVVTAYCRRPSSILSSRLNSWSASAWRLRTITIHPSREQGYACSTCHQLPWWMVGPGEIRACPEFEAQLRHSSIRFFIKKSSILSLSATCGSLPLYEVRNASHLTLCGTLNERVRIVIKVDRDCLCHTLSCVQPYAFPAELHR